MKSTGLFRTLLNRSQSLEHVIALQHWSTIATFDQKKITKKKISSADCLLMRDEQALVCLANCGIDESCLYP